MYNGHPWDPKIEAVIDRWTLFKGRLYYTICNWAFKLVAFVAKWPLFRSGRYSEVAVSSGIVETAQWDHFGTKIRC